MHLKNKSADKRKFIDWGLWRFTRHPNYFGEALMWWGIAVIACSIQLGFLTLFAPLLGHLGLRYLQGVPLLEAKYKDNVEWKKYCEETNCFMPWFVRKSKNYGQQTETKANE